MSFSITSSEPRRFAMRAYVIAIVVLAAAWLGGTMAANVTIDPQGVFGTDLIHYHLNPNGRYRVYRDYLAAAQGYDGVLFASSRGNLFDRTLLAEAAGVHAVANFSVPFGLMSDHLPELEFLIRDKASRGQRLAVVLLVLDADFFGKKPWTNLNIDSFLPPQVSGEAAWRFWWRYLTAYQFNTWKKSLNTNVDAQRRAAAGAAGAGAGAPMPAGEATVELSGPEIRADLSGQLDQLARFVALCRQNDIRLVTAFSPLRRTNVSDSQASDADRIVDAVSRIVPVWDFGRPAWLSERGDLWLDNSHYSTAVADMMVRRVFGQETSAPEDFGRRRGEQ
jgi:hypothetical protein